MIPIGALFLIVLAELINNVSELPNVGELSKAPTVLVIDGKVISVRASVWIPGGIVESDVPTMPIISVNIGENGKPLPENPQVEALVIAKGKELWIPDELEDQSGFSGGEITVVARNGPPWHAGDSVEVYLRIRDSFEVVHWLKVTTKIVSVW